MYRYSQQIRMDMTNVKLQKRIMLTAIILLLCALVIMTILGVSAMRYREKAKEQFLNRMIRSAAAACSIAESLPSSIQSSTNSRLAQIRQHVYAMEQLNDVNAELSGEEARLIEEAVFSELYSDLDDYDKLIQVNTYSTLETRTLLIEHLTALESSLTILKN